MEAHHLHQRKHVTKQDNQEEGEAALSENLWAEQRMSDLFLFDSI
jgi:hypothetical protein